MIRESRLHRHLPATRSRDFRMLWGAGAASSVALWTLLLGNAWVVYQLSGSSLWVGVSTFAGMAPYFVAPFAGVLADKAERRSLARWSRLASLAATVLLFAVAVAGAITVWIVVVMAFVQGLIRSVQTSADSALIANVVPSAELGNAIALTTMSQQGSRAVGPLLAGPLLATLGVQGAYGIAVVFSVLAFLSITQVRATSRGGVESFRHVGSSLKEALKYVRDSGPVRAVFLLVVAHCSLTMSFDAMLPGFAETELHSASSAFTLMTLGVGVGALIGTFILSVVTGLRRGPLYLAMAIGSGIAPFLMGWSMNILPATASAIFMGSTQAMFMAMTAMLLQEVIPDAMRGRVMSLYLMSAGGIMAIANLGFSALADRWGAPVLFWAPGAAFVAIVLASLAAPHLRRVYRTGSMPRPTPIQAEAAV
ncbi:MAG: MFS transporter [Tepidiformaceae bacterium]